MFRGLRQIIKIYMIFYLCFIIEMFQNVWYILNNISLILVIKKIIKFYCLLFRKYIEAMLATYIEKDGVQVKLVTIQYASDVFPHDNVATR